MRALTAIPGKAGSARVDDVEEPPEADGPVLVETLAVGVCGTDVEITRGDYGWAPPGSDRLVLGHESLGRVLEAPAGTGASADEIAAGDLVVGIVRRPDPVPCANCAIGEWDFCRNGQYTERGIKQRDGYCSERYRIDPDFAVKVDPSLGPLAVLLEPTSVIAKGWEQVERIGSRARWTPERALVTGAGPIGLLATMLACQRGLEVHVLDQVTSGPKPELVRDLGAHYHTGSVAEACDRPDVVMECTGVGSLVFDAMDHMGPGGVLCLTGLSSGGRSLDIDSDLLNRTMVLENEAVVGSVNANRRHYQAAADALARAENACLERIISRTVPLERFEDAFDRRPDDIKVVIEVGK